MDTQLLTISALVGLAMPGVISIINRHSWSPQTKAVCAFACCVVAAGIVAWWDASLSWHDYRLAILTLLTAAMGFYHTWWRPSGIADGIERKTG